MDNHNSLSENDSLPIPIEFCKIFAIQEILNGNPELSTIFFSYLSPEESLNIIQSLFVSDPPSAFKTSKNIPTIQHYRWMLSCFISFFISQIPGRKKFILPNYYFNVQKKIQLSMYSSKTTNSINKLLSNPIIRMSNEQQIKLVELLLKLYDETRPLFEWIIEYREINKYFRSIPFSTFFTQFDYKCFELYQVEINDKGQENTYSIFDTSELTGTRFFFKEKEEIESFFSIPSVLFDGKPIIFFQDTYFKDHPYPYQYQYYEVDEETNKMIFSLIHTSTSLKKFFVDIVKDDISKSLNKNNEELQQLQDPSNIKNVKNEEYNEIIKNNQNRLNKTVENSMVLNEMQSWTFLSLFPNIISNYEQFYEQIESLSFVSQNIATDIFERLKNDRILFNKIHEWTGKFVNTNNFVSKSMPSEIFDFLKNLDPDTVSQYIEEKPLLCLSDEDKIKDCDFLYSYLAISNELKAISAKQDFDEIEPIATEIGICIEKISSIEKKNSIITDLFSLLFLTDKNQFLFQTLSMHIISQILINNASDKILPYINNGLTQIQLYEQSAKKKQLSFDYLFTSSKNKLLNALINNNTVFAENLAKTNSENQKLFSSYRTVKKYIHQIESNRNQEVNLNTIDNDESNSSFININEKPINEVEEVALSIEGQNVLFDRILKESNTPEVKQLAKSCDYRKPFKIVRTFSKHKFNLLKEKLENKNETKWTTPSFIIEHEGENLTSNDQQIIFNDQSKLNNVKLLRGFFEYLDLLIPTLLSPGQTVETVLNKSVDEILDEFLNKKEFEKAEKLSETMKVDIRKKVLSSLKYQHECYEHYTENSKPVLTTLSILGNWKEYFLQLNSEEDTQKVILKLLSDDGKNENLRKFILKTDDFDPPKSDNIYDEIEFKDNFYQEGFNVTEKVLSDTLESNNNDLFIDLCFRSTTQQIENVFDKHLNDDNIDNLFELVKICPVSFQYRNKCQLLYDLHHKYSYQISSRNQSFIDLLNDKKYFDAERFYGCFPNNKVEFDEIVRQSLTNNVDDVNKIDVGIIMVAPHMRKEILDFFKQIRIEEEESRFQDLIPLNWIYMNDFEETVKSNISNDPIGAIQLLKEFELLDCDKIIIEYLDQNIIQNDDISSIEKIHFLRKESSQFIVVIRNISLMSDFIESNLINILLSMKIDSEDDEFNLNTHLKSLINFLSSKIFSQKNFDKKITSLYHFCSLYFYTRYNFAYNLNEIEKIILFSADKGFYSIVNELIEVFNIDITEKSFEIYLKQFRLCIYNSKPPLSFSLNNNNLQSEVKIELQQKCSNNFAFCASKQSEINGSIIQKVLSSIDEDKIDTVCQSVLYSVNTFFIRKDDDFPFNLNERKSEIFDFFSDQSDIETASKFYVTDVEQGFKLLENLNEKVTDESEVENQRKIGFVDLFVTSLSYSKMNIFMKMLRQFDPNNSKYARFLTKMYNECNESNLPFLKFTLSQIMNDFLTTAKTALKVYTIKPDLAYLDIAESSLNELSKKLTQAQSTQTEKSSQNSEGSQNSEDSQNSMCQHLDIVNIPLLLDNISKTLNRISLQRQFIVFCIERRISDYETLNLFHGDAAAGSIVALLFKNSEFRLSTEILFTLDHPETGLTDEYKIEPCENRLSDNESNWFNESKSRKFDNSLNQAAFSLANDGFDAVLKFVFSLQQNMQSEKEFERIIYAFVKLFESAPFDEIEWIKRIALNAVRNKEFKVKILIEIGEFDSAADIVIEKKNKLEHLIPLIANLSFARANMSAFYKCQKALEYS